MTDAPRRHLLPRPKSSPNQNQNSLSVSSSPTPTSSSSSTPSPSLRLAPTPSTIRRASVPGASVVLPKKKSSAKFSQNIMYALILVSIDS